MGAFSRQKNLRRTSCQIIHVASKRLPYGSDYFDSRHKAMQLCKVNHDSSNSKYRLDTALHFFHGRELRPIAMKLHNDKQECRNVRQGLRSALQLFHSHGSQQHVISLRKDSHNSKMWYTAFEDCHSWLTVDGDEFKKFACPLRVLRCEILLDTKQFTWMFWQKFMLKFLSRIDFCMIRLVVDEFIQ